MSTPINTTLQQQSRAEPPKELQIVDGKEVRIVIGIPPKHKAYSVQILALADKSQIRLNLAWSWLWLFVICILCLTLYWLAKSWWGISFGVYEFPFIAGLSLTSILALVMFGLKLARKRVFVSRLARVRLFDMLISNPNHRAYKQFLDNLNQSLVNARQFWNLKHEHQVAGEMRMLRRLAEEGVIKQSDYEKAKQKLFSTKKQ